MSIDVRRQYFYQSVWTCIKVLSEHILWTECYYFELIFSVFYALSISPTYSMSLVLSFPLNLFFGILCLHSFRTLHFSQCNSHICASCAQYRISSIDDSKERISPDWDSTTLTWLPVGEWFESNCLNFCSNPRPFSFLFIDQRSEASWPDVL